MEHIAAFVPIKLNNQRLPGKNVMDLDGAPLCTYIFDTVAQLHEVERKYVYCSDEAIIPYIPSGMEFLKRDKYLDGNEVKGLEIIDYFVKEVDADIYLLTHATQPFTRLESLRLGLKMVLSGEYDSAFSAVKLQDYLWMDGKPVNYNMKDIVRTQELKPFYLETGAFFIFRKEVFTQLGQRIGEKPYICELDPLEATDIDTKEDFNFAKVVARYLKEKRGWNE